MMHYGPAFQTTEVVEGRRITRPMIAWVIQQGSLKIK